MTDLADPIEELYVALAAGDASKIDALLAPSFVGILPAGLPSPIGGVHRGPQAMRDSAWWEIGRLFRVEAQPEEWLEIGGRRLLVLGTYRGTARASSRPLEAPFAHLWELEDRQVVGLRHFTDTALWREALDPEGER